MKNLLLIFFLSLSITKGYAQREAAEPEIYRFAEVMPEFPGGTDALYKYLSENIQYPDSAQLHGIEGKVNIKFVVDENGDISNVSSMRRPIGYGIEEEAIRVVKSMPKWKPGKNNGKTVKTYFTVPILFVLAKEDKELPEPNNSNK